MDMVVQELHLELLRADHGQTVDTSEGAGLDQVRELVTNQELFLSAQLEEGPEELLVRPEHCGLVDVMETLQNVGNYLGLCHHGRPGCGSQHRQLGVRVGVGVGVETWLELLGDITAAQLVQSLQLHRVLALLRVNDININIDICFIQNIDLRQSLALLQEEAQSPAAHFVLVTDRH